MTDLHLNVKKIYFDQHRSGDKPFEYRLYNEYWIKRLVGRDYNHLFYKSGYPKKGDKSKIDIMPYKGYEIQTRTHPHFGIDPVKVFAIKLTVDTNSTQE
tara:strand:- start:903 stop:1199 length:297 start_codon:yes stop_codon:yes gene_type:complete